MLLDITAQTVGTNKKFPFRDKLWKCLIPYYNHTQNSDFQIFGSFKNVKSINFVNRRNFFFEKQREDFRMVDSDFSANRSTEVLPGAAFQ